MYKGLYLTLTKLTILLGIVAFSFTITWTIFEIPYLQQTTINNVDIWYFESELYLNNLQLSWDGLQEIWSELLPPRIFNDPSIEHSWDMLWNNLACVFDYLYMPINFLLTILRSIAFMVVKFFSILGMVTLPNTQINGVLYQPPWFVNMFNTIRDNFFIPYI